MSDHEFWIEKLERCFACDEPTGRAGKGEDSIYCEYCDRGPFCPECFQKHEDGQIVVDVAPGYSIAGIRCPEDQ